MEQTNCDADDTDNKLDSAAAAPVSGAAAVKIAKSGNDVVRFTESTSSSSSSSSSSDHSFPRSPDGGWGWIVVAASLFAHAIIDGYAHSVGVLFDCLLDEFSESKASTAWVGSLFVSMPAICGPIASILTNKFGCQRITIAGGLIAAVGCILASFSNSIGSLCVTFGVIAGFGLSLVYVPATVIVAFYFDKKRAFATGLAAAGSGIGGFVFPPLIDFLLDEYTWRGAFVILGAVMLNVVVCGALFRPLIEFKLRRQRQRYLRSLERFSRVSSRRTSGDAIDSRSSQQNDDCQSREVPGLSSVEPMSYSMILLPTYLQNDFHSGAWPVPETVHYSCTDSQSVDNLSSSRMSKSKQAFQMKLESLRNNAHGNAFVTETNGRLESQMATRVKQRSRKDKTRKTTRLPNQFLPQYHRDICYRGSLLKAGFLLRTGRSVSCPDIFVHSKRKKSTHILGRLSGAFRGIWSHVRENVDFCIFRSPLFVLFCVHSMLLYISYDTPYVYLPDHAETLNVSEWSSSFLISIIGISSTVGQVVMGYIGDRTCINRLLFYVVMTCGAGLVTLAVPLLNSFGWLASYCAVYGFFMSANFSLTTVIVVELLGMDQLTNAYGFVSLSEGLANVVGPPLAGWMTDVTDSYNASFMASGIGICISGLLLLVAPLVRRCDKIAVKPDSKSDSESDSDDDDDDDDDDGERNNKMVIICHKPAACNSEQPVGHTSIDIEL